jgi:hypothetical protein
MSLFFCGRTEVLRVEAVQLGESVINALPGVTVFLHFTSRMISKWMIHLFHYMTR